MSLTVTNLIQGPARMYYGDVGASEPLASAAMNTTPPTSSWNEFGFTTDGIAVAVEMDWEEMTADQVPDVLGYRMSKRAAKVTTTVSEPTLDNLKIIMNGGTITSGSGVRQYTPDNSDTAYRPTPKAILVDGDAPDSAAGARKRRRVIIRKAVNIGNIEEARKKDEKAGYEVELAGLYVSDTIEPFIYNDQT